MGKVYSSPGIYVKEKLFSDLSPPVTTPTEFVEYVLDGVMSDGRYVITDVDGSRITGAYPLKSEADLYSDEAKPHVFSFYANHEEGVADDNQWFNSNVDDLIDARIGVVCLFNGCYTSGHLPTEVGSEGKKFYIYDDPSAVRDFVDDIHTAGMKAIAYIYEPTHSVWGGQSARDTLLLMDEFGGEYDLDGWYIDGGLFGSQMITLRVFKHLAKMYDVVMLHDSTSLIDGRWPDTGKEVHYPYGIIPSVHVRQYCTHTLTNEVLAEYQPQDEYDFLWDSYISDEGIGNTIRSIKWADRSPMTESDMFVTAAQKRITVPFKRSTWGNSACAAYLAEYESQRAAA